MRRRTRSFALTIVVCLLSVLPARAETIAEQLQRQLWTYGDTTPNGWTGGDGTYSVLLPDRRVVWLFSDSFLGPTNADGSRPTNAPFVHNSMVVQNGAEYSTNLPMGYPRTLIEPPDRVTFYWVGDALVENNELLVFVMHFAAAPAPYAFQQIGTDVARFSLDTLTLQGVTPMPFAFAPGDDGIPVSYGAAVLRQGGYDYLYGTEDIHLDKYLHLARVPADHLLDGAWEYWTGVDWSRVPARAVRLMTGVANELSVHRIGDRLALVTQDHAVGDDVMMSTAPAPEGPWSAPVAIFHIPATAGLVTYNAKAHEEFSTDHSLVITYNANTTPTNSAALYSDITNYRPRFVQVAI
ncbi:MAG: DUF5005 domain-containing protein [Actinomycetota bacterium]|nr:DUF5005 domain-containing protein [Actinomycetota bacterium]